MSFRDSIIGMLLVGIFFNTFLYGLVTYQFALYYHCKRSNDSLVTRYMVLFLFILDTFHSTAVIYMAYDYTVTNYGNTEALAVAEWPYTFTPIGNALTALVTQLYLALRIWRLTNSMLLYGVIILLAIPPFVLGIVCGVKASIIQVLTELPRITPLVIAWLSMEVIVDALITTTLIIILYRSRTGFHRTDTILNRLIRGAVQTGLFAGIFSVGGLIALVCLPGKNLYGMFAIPVGRIYTNTLLDTLLIRDSLKRKMLDNFSVSEQSGPINFKMAAADASQATSTLGSGGIQLQVKNAVQELCDQSRPVNSGEEGQIAPHTV